MSIPFAISTRPDGGWAVDVPEPAAPAAPEDAPPDSDVVRFYSHVRSVLEPHVGDRAALGAVEQLLLDELADLEDPKRPSRMAQIASVRTELARFVAALKESPSAFAWRGSSTGGLDIDPQTGKTLYRGGQESGYSFFPDEDA